jgi:hypothetical protein
LIEKIGGGGEQVKKKKPSSSHSLRAFLWVESGEVISGFFTEALDG